MRIVAIVLRRGVPSSNRRTRLSVVGAFLAVCLFAWFGVFGSPPVGGGSVPPPNDGPASSPPAGVTHAAPELGLFEDLQYLTGPALDRRLDEYAALGVQWARFQVIWADVQRGGPDSYDWSHHDGLVQGLQKRGIKALAVLGTSPGWAQRALGCSGDTCAPTYPAQFGAFARTVATRYAGRVAAWEVWNEPNIVVFYRPQPDPIAYTALLKSVYPAIKGADPGTTVLVGGPAPAVTTTDSTGLTTAINPVSFMQDLYNLGGQGYFDAVGWHPYSYPAMPRGADPGSTWVQMDGVRGLMSAHGDGGKKIWATEFGAHTDPMAEGYLSEAQQAAYFAIGIDLWRGYRWAGPMIIYQLRDRGTDIGDRENFFGLERADGSHKPSYAAVRAWLPR